MKKLILAAVLLILGIILSGCIQPLTNDRNNIERLTTGNYLTICDYEALEGLEFEVIGIGEIPKTTQGLILKGRIKEIIKNGKSYTIKFDYDDTEVTLTINLPLEYSIDLKENQNIEVNYRNAQGFGGVAKGLKITDAAGVVLIADDSGYGRAFNNDELEGFAISQEDTKCRNRKNTPAPGSLNNFYLVCSYQQDNVKLVQGEIGSINNQYDCVALESTSRVDDAWWTDAPYNYQAYLILRKAS